MPAKNTRMVGRLTSTTPPPTTFRVYVYYLSLTQDLSTDTRGVTIIEERDLSQATLSASKIRRDGILIGPTNSATIWKFIPPHRILEIQIVPPEPAHD